MRTRKGIRDASNSVHRPRFLEHKLDTERRIIQPNTLLEFVCLRRTCRAKVESTDWGHRVPTILGWGLRSLTFQH